MTVFVFQEPSLLSSLQDNGLTDVMLHALLIKDVSPLLFLCKECSLHTLLHDKHLPTIYPSPIISLCNNLVRGSWHLYLNAFRGLQIHLIFSLGSCYPWSPWLPPKCIQCTLLECPRSSVICAVSAFWTSFQSSFVSRLPPSHAKEEEFWSSW